MPRPSNRKQMLSARISQLEQELKNLPDDLFLDEDDYLQSTYPESSRNTSNLGKQNFTDNLDADFFDIEMEPATTSVRGNVKLQFHQRGKARGLPRRGRNMFRPTMYRGKYIPSFKPPESVPFRTQDLYYDDEEDWSRYVSHGKDREEQLNREDQTSTPSEETRDSLTSSKLAFQVEKDNRPSMREEKYSRSVEASKKEQREDKMGPEEKDMFYFPSEKVEKVSICSGNEATPTSEIDSSSKESGSNKTSSVMSIFEELQAKLSSSVKDLPGYDILAETLKKLEQLKKEQTEKPETVSSTFIPPVPPKGEIDKIDKQKNQNKNKDEDPKPETAQAKLKEHSPTRKVTYTGSHKRQKSPLRKRENSPSHRREPSPLHKKRESPLPSTKRPISPSRRRRSPSPSKKRRSPSPRRKPGSTSPLRRRRASVSPRRKRESDSPSRKKRQSDWFLRRSPKRRRSRSRSPRKDYRRSRSPPKRHDHTSNQNKRKDRSHSPLSLLPDRKKGHWKETPIKDKWYRDQRPEYSHPPDLMQQPKPPGGENSDVYTETNHIATGVSSSSFDSGRPPPQFSSLSDLTRTPYQGYPEYNPPNSQFYPPFQPRSNAPAPPFNVVGPSPNILGPNHNIMHSSVVPLVGPPIRPPVHTHIRPPMIPQEVAAIPPQATNLISVIEAHNYPVKITNFSSNVPPQPWSEQSSTYNDGSHSVPHHQTVRQNSAHMESQEDAKRKGVENEMKKQKETLLKQRQEYVDKQAVLRKDLDDLAKQKRELIAEKRADNESIIRENNKLQLEVQNKLKAIANVIDMLSGIIGEEDIEEITLSSPPPLKRQNEEKVISLDSPPQSRSPANNNPPPPGEDTAMSKIPSRWLQPHQSLKGERLENSSPVKRTSVTSSADKEKLHTPVPRNPTPKAETVTPKPDMPSPKLETQSAKVELLRPATPPPLPSAIQLPPALQSSEELNSSGIQETSEQPRFNVVHFDPELHWCRVCNIFPRTAKEFLNHLHTPDHKQTLSERKLVDMPWHAKQVIEETTTFKDAPTKRVPIKGLQFFISATAWYCKLCDTWIGDLHCASVHLKSSQHTQKYADFTDTNPHWEVDWLALRTRAYEQTAEDRSRLDANKLESDKDLPDSHSHSGAHKTESKPTAKSDKTKLVKTASEQLMSSLKDDLEKSHNKRIKETSERRKMKCRSTSSSSTSRSSSTSSSSDDGATRHNKSQNVSVALRKKDKKESEEKLLHVNPVDVSKLKSKWDSPEKELEEKKTVVDKDVVDTDATGSSGDDKLLKEWMEIANVLNPDQQIMNELTDKLKLKQQIYRSIEKIKETQKQRQLQEERLKNHHEDRKKSSSGDKRKNEKSGRDEKRNDNSEKSDRKTDSSDRSDRRYGSSQKSDRKSDKTGRSVNSERNTSKSKNSDRSPKRNYKRDSRSKPFDTKSKSADSKFKSGDSKSKPDKIKEEIKPDKPISGRKGMWMPTRGIFETDESSSENEAEGSKFEKPLIESTFPKNKKTISINVSKTRLPFIGRMPFMSKINTVKKIDDGGKKTDDTLQGNNNKTNGEEKSEDVEKHNNKTEIEKSEDKVKEDGGNLIWPNIPEIEHKEEVETVIDNASKEQSRQKPSAVQQSRWDAQATVLSSQLIPRTTLTLSKTPTLAQRLAQAQQIATALMAKTPQVSDGTVDMEIDDEDKPEESLPVDFQATLDILFPPNRNGSHLIEVTETPLPVNTIDSMPPSNIAQLTSTSNIAMPPSVSPLVYVSSSTKYIDPNVPDSLRPLHSGPVEVMQPPAVYVKHSTMLSNQESIGDNQWVQERSRDPMLLVAEPMLDQGTIRPEHMEHSLPMLPLDLVHQIRFPPPSHAPMGLGSMNHAPMGPGTMEQRSVVPAPMDRGHVGQGSLDNVPMQLRPMDHVPGSMGPRLIIHRPLGPGPLDLGPRGPSPVGSGPMVPGPMPVGPRQGGAPPPPPPGFPMGPQPISPDTVVEEYSVKKKNPPSQKKRNQMKRRREELEAKDKELKEKIVHQLEILANKNKEEKEKAAKKIVLDELAMLGIDEDDLAAQPPI